VREDSLALDSETLAKISDLLKALDVLADRGIVINGDTNVEITDDVKIVMRYTVSPFGNDGYYMLVGLA